MLDEQPDSFIDGVFQLTNFSANDVITESHPIERGFKAVVEDVNFNFTTSGGQIFMAKRLSSGVLRRVTTNFSSDTSGSTKIKLNEGESLAIVLAATGSGVVETVCDGRIIQKRKEKRPIQITVADFGI